MKQIDVIVREVGLRDGLQIHPTFMPTESKIAWIVDLEQLLQVRSIVHAALPDIEMHGALARAGLPRNYVRADGRRAA